MNKLKAPKSWRQKRPLHLLVGPVYWCLKCPDGQLESPCEGEWSARESLFWKMVEVDEANRERLWKNTRKTTIAAKKVGWSIACCGLFEVTHNV